MHSRIAGGLGSGGQVTRIERRTFEGTHDAGLARCYAESAIDILNHQAKLRKGARARAEAAFGLDAMLEKYLIALGIQA